MENDTDVCYNVRHTLPELNRIEIAVETVSEYIYVHSNVFICLFLNVCVCMRVYVCVSLCVRLPTIYVGVRMFCCVLCVYICVCV